MNSFLNLNNPLVDMAEDVDPEILCQRHAEPSIIQTYIGAYDIHSNSPMIFRIIGCIDCGHVMDYISGISEPDRFTMW